MLLGKAAEALKIPAPCVLGRDVIEGLKGILS